MSAYLGENDLTAFGASSATTAQIQQASAIIDGYLSKPEGLLFTADSRGAPCYMTGASPSATFQIQGAIGPGQNVSVTVEGFVTQDLVGDVLVIDRTPQTPAPEALVVGAVSGQTITFASVLASHSSGATLEAGMVILEERSLPARRAIARVSKTPISRLISGMGRYGYGRRSDQFSGIRTPDLIACLAQFGSTPQWIAFDVTQASISSATGEIWIPAGLYLDNFSDVRLRYVAGYPTVPIPVKQVCADLIKSISAFPEMVGNILSIQAGGTAIKRAAASLMTDEMKGALSPFAAHLYF